MKKAAFITLALVSAFATAQTANNSAYKAAHDKAEANYKAAKERCEKLKDNAQDVCEEEAKVAQAQAERDAVAKHKNTGNELQRADRKLAEAKFELAQEKCDDLSGDAKDSCQAQARSMKANMAGATAGDGRTAVLVDNGTGAAVAGSAADVRDRTAAAADRAGDRTAAAMDRAGDRTAAATANARDKASDMAANAKEKTSDMAANAKEKTADATGTAKAAMSDTMITAKVKADMAADKTVKAMDVHVETQKGVVMLSGFVPSKAEAERAVELAKGVQGVTDVKSSIQVKK
ncbi:BON domain-containing protein [Pseudoduganella sp. SL102]|uniref:BON domain-containing protein n=1 Tax=Pseudoduganella sp. SL102 TaxID=2995154 RepID=UPI00248CE66B|nr:BON domain-containing protein [Pseudoduganella sp. SL102]WBS01884.1 BON domain-containing protein [Pseudoduganella sp. SL102]